PDHRRAGSAPWDLYFPADVCFFAPLERRVCEFRHAAGIRAAPLMPEPLRCSLLRARRGHQQHHAHQNGRNRRISSRHSPHFSQKRACHRKRGPGSLFREPGGKRDPGPLFRPLFQRPIANSVRLVLMYQRPSTRAGDASVDSPTRFTWSISNFEPARSTNVSPSSSVKNILSSTATGEAENPSLRAAPSLPCHSTRPVIASSAVTMLLMALTM